MKYILFIFIIAFTDYVFGQGDAPPLLQGQYQGSKSVGSFIQTPNAGVTKINSSTALIETGNNNILVNPSFEHQVFSTGWTVGSGTFTEETVVEIHGKKAAKLVLSSQTMALTQDSSLYAAQFADGVQGLASVRVKSDVALKVCSRSAGVTSSSLCVDVQANNKWGLYRVPFILGATSNGISIASTGAVTGTVYIDDAFVGAASLTQNMNACNDVSCETVFSAKVSATGVVSEENQNFINGNCVVTSTSLYTCSFNSSIYTVAPNCTVSNSNAGLNLVTRLQGNATSSQVVIFVESTANSPVAGQFNIVCQKQGADFTAAKQLSNGNTYSSTNADTDWASCGHTAASFTGFGTVSAIETQCKRDGSDLLMRGKFTSGTVTAVEARMSLPIWNGVQLISAGVQKIPSIQLSGIAGRTGNSAAPYSSLIEPSVSYVTFGLASGTTGGILLKRNGNDLILSGESWSINARIPISGWDNSNIIIGQFNGLESCSSTLDCTDTFSAKVSAAGVVSDENVDWINGNASIVSTSQYTITFKAGIFTVAPTCTITNKDTNHFGVDNVSETSSILSYGTVNTGNGVNNPTAVNIICQKQGVDYVGKTAKAVASDQNVRSIGSTGMDIQSVFFGSGANCGTACTTGTCTICSQVGSKITSVTWVSAGNYNLNGIDGTKYICTSNGSTSISPFAIGGVLDKANSSASLTRVSFGGNNVANASSTCIGIP